MLFSLGARLSVVYVFFFFFFIILIQLTFERLLFASQFFHGLKFETQKSGKLTKNRETNQGKFTSIIFIIIIKPMTLRLTHSLKIKKKTSIQTQFYLNIQTSIPTHYFCRADADTYTIKPGRRVWKKTKPFDYRTFTTDSVELMRNDIA